ncbi:MAG: hypothetical protein ACTJLL_02435, partial [Anaplasma sp.]
SDPRSGGTAEYAATTPKNVSHKICGTGHGTANDVTNKTNCRSGAPAAAPSGKNAGLGIGSENVTTKKSGGTNNGKALTGEQWDTLVKAFEADNASTAGEDNKACSESDGNCRSNVKAGSAFDGAPNAHKIKPDVAGTMASAIVTAGTGEAEVSKFPSE